MLVCSLELLEQGTTARVKSTLLKTNPKARKYCNRKERHQQEKGLLLCLILCSTSAHCTCQYRIRNGSKILITGQILQVRAWLWSFHTCWSKTSPETLLEHRYIALFDPCISLYIIGLVCLWLLVAHLIILHWIQEQVYSCCWNYYIWSESRATFNMNFLWAKELRIKFLMGGFEYILEHPGKGFWRAL